MGCIDVTESDVNRDILIACFLVCPTSSFPFHAHAGLAFSLWLMNDINANYLECYHN